MIQKGSFLIRIWAVILSVVLSGLFFGSAERAIDKIQEARIAETAREMAVSNEWVVPHYNGELRLQKPPLTYWTTALSYKAFGVSELAARIPSASFGLLTALLLFIWLKREISISTAANTALVLATSFLGLRYLRSAEADVTLMFFIVLAAYAGFRLLESGSKRLVWLLMLTLGLGFLTKGPAGIAIPMLTIVGYAYATKQLAALKALANPAGLGIFLVGAFAWYAWILLMMPDVAQGFFGKQVDETFISGTHQQPVYWYLAHALEFFLPWSFLLIPAGIWCYKHRPLPKVIHFALIWLGVVFVLLTFTVNKQTQYALLFLPPIAIVVGYYLEVAVGRYYQYNRIVFYLLCFAVLGMVIAAIRKHGVNEILASHATLIWLLILGLPLALKKAMKATAPNMQVLIAAIFATFCYLFAEQYLTKDVEKDDIRTLMQTAANKPELYQLKPGNGSISFYAQRAIKPLNEKQVQQALAAQPILWLVGKDKNKPNLPNIQLDEEMKVGGWALWKLTPLP